MTAAAAGDANGRAGQTILVTGARGQVGDALRRHRWPDGWVVEALDSTALDLADTAAIRATVAAGGWAAVINAAAYTAVDKAESDVTAAWRINALAPAALAEACREADIPLVQVSTDYVFDGSKPDGWEVDDPVAPLNVYGASKLGGELAVRTAAPRHAIVRTSWVVSAHGHNFVKTMLRLGAERERLSIVADQHGAPTSATDLAAALATIAIRLVEQPCLAGTWHFSNAGETHWADLARAIFAAAQRHGGPAPEIVDIDAIDFPVPAKRPRHSRLSHAAVARDFALTPRDWRIALDEIVAELMGARA
ncbi:dTDP-4-dehydrorhamnose reductase [Sphingomonas sp. BK235]|uniref:dTDP-4-dehydrorhamnose reductase n=1 Tax=Sphingomonas sp. BK235 TaxID=2512131 RepID=UPI0010E8C6A5|nr:dTDP-4-dehydrorhamnose reductase [Sphingomonas sp. BK235]TCP29687.1 dTDP-4-dehydrorhamnose reductase [Sphingomonas sp. BK235]